jgi:MFS family permease
VVVFVAFAILLGASETPASSILHGCVEDHQRSTLLSLRSLIQQLGAAVGLVLAGAIAEGSSTTVAWSVGAVCLLLAAVLCVVLARRLAAGTR